MRIIWIEDFGNAPEPFYYVSRFFKDLLGETVLDKYWDRDEIDLRDNPKALLEFCQKHDRQHEVILCRHYHDFEETIANYTVLQDIDVILIDINLSAGIDPAKPIPAGYKPEEGGFYIYNALIREVIINPNFVPQNKQRVFEVETSDSHRSPNFSLAGLGVQTLVWQSHTRVCYLYTFCRVIWTGLRAIQSFGCFQIMESKIYLGRHNKRKKDGVQDLSWTSQQAEKRRGWSPRFILDVRKAI